MRDEIIAEICKNKIIAILRGIKGEDLLSLAQALYDGGIRLLEVTFSADGSVRDEDTARSIALLASEFKGRMYVGAGTVLTKEQVRLTKASGGAFIISPNTDKRVIKESKKLGLVSIPGALTPSEIVEAHEYGADFVKLFPVTSMGAEYVKALKAPLSHIKLLAVGGIDENNMSVYLKAGACGFGIGSNITDKKMIAENDWEGIKALARKYTAGVNGIG